MSIQPQEQPNGLTPEQNVILSFANNPQYRRPSSGLLNWRKLVADHPDHAKTIQYGESPYRRGAYILDQLAKKKLTSVRLKPGQIKASTGTATSGGLTEQEQFLTEMVKAHTKENGCMKGGQKLTRMRQAGLLPALPGTSMAKHKVPRTDPAALLAEAQAMPTPEEVERKMQHKVQALVMEKLNYIISEAACCPRCGKSIENQLRLAVMEVKAAGFKL